MTRCRLVTPFAVDGPAFAIGGGSRGSAPERQRPITALAGGTLAYGIPVANLQTFNLNHSFADGIPDQWARDHLIAGAW